MKKNSRILPYLFLSCFMIIHICSCHRNAEEIRTLLRDSEALLENDPEAAYGMLDSLDIYRIRPRSLRAEAALLYTKAQYKSYQEIRSDSIISLSERYYRNRGNDDYRWAESRMYMGNVHQELGDPETAIGCYMDVLEHLEPEASDSTAYEILALTCDRLTEVYEGHMFRSNLDMEYYHKSIRYYSLSRDSVRLAYAYKNYGKKIIFQEPSDSAEYYLRLSEKVSRMVKDTICIIDTRLYLMHYYNYKGLYDHAIRNSQETLEEFSICLSDADYDDYLQVMADAYAYQGNVKAAEDCFAKLDSLGLMTSLERASIEYKLCVIKGEYREAIRINEKLGGLISEAVSEKDQINVYNTEKRYNYMKVKAENALLYERQVRTYMVIAVVFLSLALVLVILYSRYRYVRQQKNLAEFQNMRLKEEKRRLEEANRLALVNSSVIPKIEKLLKDTFDALYGKYQDNELIGGSKQIRDKMNKILRSEFEKLLNSDIYKEESDNIWFSRLSLQEKIVYVLHQSGYDRTSISMILNISSDQVYTVQKRIKNKFQSSVGSQNTASSSSEQYTD